MSIFNVMLEIRVVNRMRPFTIIHVMNSNNNTIMRYFNINVNTSGKFLSLPNK